MSTFTVRPSTSQSSSVFALYRFYGADDALLYIGLTRNPAKRLEKHAGDKSWWNQVARIEFQHFNDLAELREAERQAISTEKPVHNIRMNRGVLKTPETRTPDPLEEVAIDGLVGRYFHTFRPYDPSDPDDELATVVNGRAVVWQGRVLEEINPELYAIETYSWWDGSAIGNQLARIDDMLLAANAMTAVATAAASARTTRAAPDSCTSSATPAASITPDSPTTRHSFGAMASRTSNNPVDNSRDTNRDA